MIYLDNAATTALAPEAFEEMKPYMLDIYGNPSSVYSFAGKAKKAMEEAREVIADTINASASEIYFTSGGTESDNWALKATAFNLKDKGKHIITTAIEHHAILHSCAWLEENGFEVTYIKPQENGIIDPKDIENSIRPDTILISVMYANNEIGSIEPIEEIGKISKEKGIIFHTDAVQAYGHIPIDVKKANIDLLSASGHKFHGPKGIGFLYMNNDMKIGPFMHGGSQERARRAGTHNVAGIVGMKKAALLSIENMEKNIKNQSEIRDYIIERIEKEIDGVTINGDREKRLPNNVNVSIESVDGESMLILLDQEEICVSSGSACTSGSLDPSHVLLAIGREEKLARGTVRMTMDENFTMKEAETVVEKLKAAVEKLREFAV